MLRLTPTAYLFSLEDIEPCKLVYHASLLTTNHRISLLPPAQMYEMPQKLSLAEYASGQSV